MGYFCYSDASYVSGRRAGYGIVVIRFDEISSQVHCREQGTVWTNSNVNAELIAMTKALRRVPDNSAGVCYSDLNCIQGLIDQTISYAKKYKVVVDALQIEVARTGLLVEFVPKQHRSHYYNQCHLMSRKAIGKTGSGKKLLKPVHVKKWWVCRSVG